MIIENPESPNLDSVYYTTPSTVATSTFASGSPIAPPETFFTDSPVFGFSSNQEIVSSRRRASLGTFAPYVNQEILSIPTASNDQININFVREIEAKDTLGSDMSSTEIMPSSNEDAPSNSENPLINLEEFLKSDPFGKSDGHNEILDEISFEPESWLFKPQTYKREKTTSSPSSRKTLEFHNLSSYSNPRLRKTQSFTHASPKKASSAGPATPLQNYIGEFHVNEGIFPIQDETPTFSKQLSYSSVHKRSSSKSAPLRRSKTATNLCINTCPRTNREHHRSMESGLVSFQLQLNNDSKS